MSIACVVAIGRVATPSVAAETCGGLPALDVITVSGYCTGIVAEGLTMPRGLAVLPDGRILVTEMGGWSPPPRGRLTVLAPTPNGWKSNVVLTGLDRPHGVAIGPDGNIYVGEAGRIVRLSLAALDRPTPNAEVAIKLRPPGTRLHSLSSFAFAPDGALYVNIGSASDNCEPAAPAERSAGRCIETEGEDAVGLVRRYHIDPKGVVTGGERFALGLRNSVALGVHPSGTVVQAENSRDAIHKARGVKHDDESPHDELNVLIAGRHYGWPFCYDRRLPAPEFPHYDCRTTEAPFRLLPAHSAPLGLTWWLGDRAPKAYRGWLVLTYHGPRKYGHRVVAFPVDASGLPSGNPVHLIRGWRRWHDVGSPVDVRAGPDGALYISDDRHGQVLRLGPRQLVR